MAWNDSLVNNIDYSIAILKEYFVKNYEGELILDEDGKPQFSQQPPDMIYFRG